MGISQLRASMCTSVGGQVDGCGRLFSMALPGHGLPASGPTTSLWFVLLGQARSQANVRVLGMSSWGLQTGEDSIILDGQICSLPPTLSTLCAQEADPWFCGLDHVGCLDHWFPVGFGQWRRWAVGLVGRSLKLEYLLLQLSSSLTVLNSFPANTTALTYSSLQDLLAEPSLCPKMIAASHFCSHLCK